MPQRAEGEVFVGTRHGKAPSASVVRRLPGTAVISCDRDNTIAALTPAAVEMCGGQDFLGRPIDSVLRMDADGRAWFGAPGCQQILVRATVMPASSDATKVVLTPLAVDTESQRAVARLREAQQLASVGYWTYDLRTELLHRSGPVSLGEGPTLGLPQAYAEVYADDRASSRRVLEKLGSGEHPGTHEWEIRDLTGRRHLRVWGTAERDETGAVVRVSGTIQDFTRLRELEQQVADDKGFMSAATQIARLATWEFDVDTELVTGSASLREMLGVDEGPISFSDCLRRVHAEDRVAVEALKNEFVSRFGSAEQVWSGDEIEFRFESPTLGLCWVRASARISSDPHVRKLIGTMVDITAQREAESQARYFDRRYSELVAASPVGIAVVDDRGIVLDVNEMFCEVFAVPAKKVLGTSLRSMRHPDETELSDSAFEQFAADSAKGKSMRRKLLRGDGNSIYCDMNVAVSIQDDGSRSWLLMYTDVTERALTELADNSLGLNDELTGLPNRVWVQQQLGVLLSGESATKLAVLFCDIDNFKRINDSVGHDLGDQLLITLAGRLRSGLPDRCTAARHSGDEFVVLCGDCDAAGGIDVVGTRIAELLAAPVTLGGNTVQVSVSVGVAVPSSGMESAADLLRFADAAMFENKRRETGTISVANAALIASTVGRLDMESELRAAIATNGLELHFQPLVNSTGHIVGAEALVRWQHPERGMLPPDAFLSIATEGDLMRDLDTWVLRTALVKASEWSQDDIEVAVNLAALLPGSADFTETVFAAIADSGIDPSRVVLELVETAMVALPAASRAEMDLLVAKGIRFAVDDFGTGQSSLARLKDLPAQIIKVDRQFVKGLGSDPSDTAVVRAVVDMAKAMGRSCVAEGVEKPRQFEALRAEGVDVYQGWLFFRAMPAEEFRTTIDSRVAAHI